MSPTPPAYFVFDIESVADAALVSKVHFGGKVPPEESIRKYRDELLAKNDSDFIPYTFQVPVSIVVAKVAEDFSLLDVVSLFDRVKTDKTEDIPFAICDKFWEGWMHYKPTLVSFNGRGFDVPMLELAAFRYGISIKEWFAVNVRSNAKNYDQPRSRYNAKFHLDLFDVLTNYGATRFNGGLNLAASLLGKPGKMSTQGYMVQDMYDAGELAKINDYCRCDVLDTYFVFLRVMVITGNLPLREEHELVKKAKDWITEQAEACPAFRQYLDCWGDWHNPRET
jgi:predicted PolB exonuclease-like 3'-5' exonuclease